MFAYLVQDYALLKTFARSSSDFIIAVAGIHKQVDVLPSKNQVLCKVNHR